MQELYCCYESHLNFGKSKLKISRNVENFIRELTRGILRNFRKFRDMISQIEYLVRIDIILEEYLKGNEGSLLLYTQIKKKN